MGRGDILSRNVASNEVAESRLNCGRTPRALATVRCGREEEEEEEEEGIGHADAVPAVRDGATELGGVESAEAPSGKDEAWETEEPAWDAVDGSQSLSPPAMGSSGL